MSQDSVPTPQRIGTDETRRQVVNYLDQHACPVGLDTLAIAVVAENHEVQPSAVPAEAKQVAVASLHHTHLPLMDDIGVIAYDREESVVEDWTTEQLPSVE